MVPARATGRAGQLKNDGSTTLTRVSLQPGPISTRCTMAPRQPSTMPTPDAAGPFGDVCSAAGQPVPTHSPTAGQLRRWLAGPELTPAFGVRLAVAAAWLLWLTLTVATVRGVAVGLAARLGRARRPVLRIPPPRQATVGGLIG